MSLHLFGVRHHGPGSARSLLQALTALDPDCLLIEGPPEAQGMLAYTLHPEMKPPVALLLYAEHAPEQAVYYPFAAFSREWQALRYGLARSLPTRFIDLPVGVSLAQHEANEDPTEARPDPLQELAAAAGFDDFERWWEGLVEERRSAEGVFAAVHELMTAVRTDQPPLQQREARREAHMRARIHDALTEGFERIAVVCGAFHGPALLQPYSEEDAGLLEGLEPLPVSATWIPWSYARLARSSGYGAGIHAPGWYGHLWAHPEGSSVRWLARVSGLLREEGLDASSAQVIEAVRLADTLAALRGHSLTGLSELNEAALAVFAHGNAQVLDLIDARLTLDDRLGAVAPEIPAAPLQRDFQEHCKRLRLTPETGVRELTLDLRKPLDLSRSQLLYRLKLLGIGWGHEAQSSSRGTFKETWQLRWQPEFELRLIEAGRFGQRLGGAASAAVSEQAQDADTELQTLAGLLELSLLAELPKAVPGLLTALERGAAAASDLRRLLGALVPLARVARYGSVRASASETTDAVQQVVSHLFTRICVGLPSQARGLSDEAAEALFTPLMELEATVKLLQDEAQGELWLRTLRSLASPQVHPLLSGRAVRFLLLDGHWAPAEVSQAAALALSNPEPEKASAFLDGLLRGDGLLLVHDRTLLGVLNGWLGGLSDDAFTRTLPLLRRTFASFEAAERRSIGQTLRQLDSPVAPPEETGAYDAARGAKVLPLARRLLGLETPT